MKIECNLRYLEEYLPTPRSRKLRHREATTTCMIDVLDISPEKAHVAFRVKSHSTDDISIPIFWHNNAFWKPEFVKNTDSLKQNTANAVRFKGEKDLRDFFNQKYQWTRCGQLQNLEEEIHRLQLHASDYAVISGLMCVKTNEPNYYVETGDDFVFISIQTWRPKGNSQLVWYFDALHFNEMKQKAAEFAKEYGLKLSSDFSDTPKTYIEVVDEKLVTPIHHVQCWFEKDYVKNLIALEQAVKNRNVPETDRNEALFHIEKLKKILEKYPDEQRE